MQYLVLINMGIGTFIQSLCVQTAVYWGNPISDGLGGFTFDSPVEISCRWEDATALLDDKSILKTGDVLVSNAEVIVLQDLKEQEYLYLGTLDDLYDLEDSSGADLDPLQIEGAYPVRNFNKIPAIKSTNEFIRKAIL